jgi:hypothetical protein
MRRHTGELLGRLGPPQHGRQAAEAELIWPHPFRDARQLKSESHRSRQFEHVHQPVVVRSPIDRRVRNRKAILSGPSTRDVELAVGCFQADGPV